MEPLSAIRGLGGVDLLLQEPGCARLQLRDLAGEVGNGRDHDASPQNRSAASATTWAQATRSSTGTHSSIAWAVSKPARPEADRRRAREDRERGAVVPGVEAGEFSGAADIVARLVDDRDNRVVLGYRHRHDACLPLEARRVLGQPVVGRNRLENRLLHLALDLGAEALGIRLLRQEERAAADLARAPGR